MSHCHIAVTLSHIKCDMLFTSISPAMKNNEVSPLP
ncbi:MAG: hypothetical protein FD188_3496, partial [Ignavibacteria bacterium]